MAILPEEIVVKDIEKLLKSREAWFYKTHGDAFGKSGIPDIIVSYNGVFITLEVKRHNGGKQSELQKFHQSEIRSSGGICEFITDVSQVEEILDGIDKDMVLSWAYL